MAKADEPITDDHLLAIGRVVVRWGMAERVIMDSLWEVATGQSFETMDKQASISLALVTGMEVRTALGILKAVFRARHPTDAGALDKLVESLDNLRDARNPVAHGRWLKGKRPKSIATVAFKSSQMLRTIPHEYTALELEALAQRITHATSVLIAFLKQHGYWKLPASGGTPVEPIR